MGNNKFIVALSSEWHRGTGTPALQNHLIRSRLCLRGALELRASESRTVPASPVHVTQSRGRHICVRFPNNTRIRVHPDRSGAPKGVSVYCTKQY